MFRLASAAVVLGCGGFAYATSFPTLHAKGQLVTYQRDVENSDLKIWLSKQGVMSAVGHNLILKVHDWQSKVSMTPDGECELDVDVDANSIQVFKHWKPTKEGGVPGIDGALVTLHDMDSWSTGQIHGTMRSSEVLDVAKYPKVNYHAKGTKKGSTLQFDGILTLHGQEHPLSLTSTISIEPDEKGRPSIVLKGETMFLQSNWGIKPLSKFMGSLQLKDQITSKWEVRYVAKDS